MQFQQVSRYNTCNKEIGIKYAETLQFYSTYNAALDFKAAVEQINPKRVAIYALSYGTFLLNSYLLVGGRADVLVMDGPVPPDRWALVRIFMRFVSRVLRVRALCCCVFYLSVR